MSKSIYLINPRPDQPHFYTGEVFQAWGFQPGVLVADLALPTVAAMMPPDFRVRICEENVEPVAFDTDADYIGITGKNTQEGRMIALAREFRHRGKTVIFGGPFATLSPERLRSECDILVRGEIENIAETFFSDLRNSTWKAEYAGDTPGLDASPLPRWDLYPNYRALSGTVQTSRGCPFECEFCDVIQYLGRKQRHKAPAQVVRELEELYALGYRSVLLADDNLTVYRARAKELLTVIAEWNRAAPAGRMGLSTQLSIDCSRDPELLRLCADAGLSLAFIGIETANEQSLKEARKRQNLGVDMAERVSRFLAEGIRVDAGLIVGFDSDDAGIFERQYEFAMSLPIPIFTVHPLVAPESTPLYARLAAGDRLVEIAPGAAIGPKFTNIVPLLMSRDQLFGGYRWLCNRIYRPEAFGDRVLRFIDAYRLPRFAAAPQAKPPGREIDGEYLQVAARVLRLGPREEAMVVRLNRYIARNPAAANPVLQILWSYMQIREMYRQLDIWDPALGERSSPA
jgi:hypothetical protein